MPCHEKAPGLFDVCSTRCYERSFAVRLFRVNWQLVLMYFFLSPNQGFERGLAPSRDRGPGGRAEPFPLAAGGIFQ